MKTIILLISLFFSTCYDCEKTITVTIVDYHNYETLVGVKNLKNDTYTDLDGKLYIKKGDDLHLNLISYEDIKIENIKKDTLIKMCQI